MATAVEAMIRSCAPTAAPLRPLDAYQWLLFMAAHNERHLGQIREVKADPNFPKS